MDTNFFGYILSGAQTITDTLFNSLPDYQPIGLAAIVSEWMNSTPVLLYVYVNQFINLTLVIALLTGIIVLETVRAVLAAWMWIKNSIPLVG